MSKHATPRFTPTHITAIAIAVAIVVVAAPVGVVAATRTLSVITDPITASHKARVTAKGSLAVTGRDPASGAQQRIDTSGRAYVGDGSGPLTVDGTVTARPGIPTTPVNIVAQERSQLAYQIPAGRSLAISSFTVTRPVSGQGPGWAALVAVKGMPANCNGDRTSFSQTILMPALYAQPSSSTVMPLPTPIVVSATAASQCLFIVLSDSTNVWSIATGYLS